MKNVLTGTKKKSARQTSLMIEEEQSDVRGKLCKAKKCSTQSSVTFDDGGHGGRTERKKPVAETLRRRQSNWKSDASVQSAA